MKQALALCMVWTLGASAAARAVTEPHLVADLGIELSSYAGSAPHGLAAVGGRVVLAAQPDDHADRLFQSDGTAGGTTALAAPCAALESGQITRLHANPAHAFYEVRCGFDEPALWASDGRAAGTGSLLAAGEFRRTTPFYAAPQWVDEGNRALFLQGGSYSSPLELWATDGTAAGTFRLGVLTQQTGATGALARRANGDYLILVWEHFAALSVWRSDGTVAGTVLATPIDLGSPSFSVRAFAATSDGIYCLIDGGAVGARQLWYSDGTVAETRWLGDFEAGVWAGLVAHDGAVFFAAEAFGGAGIWRSDGTVATTRRIVELASVAVSADSFAFLDDRIYWLGFAWSGVSGALYGAPIAGGAAEELLQTCIGSYCSPLFDGYWLRTVGESLVFSRFEGGAAAVWRSGGVAGDASLLAPLCEALDCDFGGYGPVVLADRLLFVHRTAGEAQELWLCDGTAAGTLRLAGPLRSLSWLSPGLTDPVAGLPADAGWLFAADDGEHGRELWHAGSQADSGRLVSDLRLDRPGLEAVESVGSVGDTFLFALPQEDGTRTLYRHDRGSPGVAPFLNIPVIRGRYGSRNPPPSLRPAGDAWYLFESDFDGDQSSEDFAQQVWRYDPVSGASRPIFADLATTGVGALAHDLYPAGEDYVLLGARDLERSPAIYLLQAATGEVAKLLDLPATSVWSIGRSGGIWFLLEDWRRIAAFDLTRRTRTVVAEFEAAIYVADALPAGLIFEVAVGPTTTGDGRKELWQSDGTAAGTQEIAQWSNRADGCTWINLPPRSANSSVLFSVQTSCEPDAELWISDGSAERTRRLRTFTGGAPGVAEGGIRYRGELYFLASAGNPGTGPPQISIWKSDGTPQGTVAVAELPTSDVGGDWSPQGTAIGAEGIYFSWTDPGHGYELWRTDGTAAGTGLLADLEPGPASAAPYPLWQVGDQVLFTAWTAATGRELWQVDGGAGAPQPVADLYPGPESSAPAALSAADDAFYFVADDGLVGREIWEVGEPSVAPCVPTPTTLCLLDGRFRARAVWRDFAGKTGEAGVQPLTGDSGYFWFFAPGNPEVLLKAVDACGLPGFENFWAYTTGLTNVEVELEIVDTVSGERQRIRTALGEAFGPLFDSGSFAVCDGAGAVASPRPAAASTAETTVLPLLGGRFTATASWETGDGRSGEGRAVAISGDSGYFWFFAPSIVEVLVKMVDACGYPGFDNYWVFAGGLTDVAVRLTVRDGWSGATVSHLNLQGAPFTPLLETGALRVCGALPP